MLHLALWVTSASFGAVHHSAPFHTIRTKMNLDDVVDLIYLIISYAHLAGSLIGAYFLHQYRFTRELAVCKPIPSPACPVCNFVFIRLTLC